MPGITIGYSTDFETDAAGWTVFGQNNSWERGIPLAGPSTAPSGENVYATNLIGPYSNSNTTLMMPPIDLPEDPAYLQFNHWHSLNIMMKSLHLTLVMFLFQQIKRNGQNFY